MGRFEYCLTPPCHSFRRMWETVPEVQTLPDRARDCSQRPKRMIESCDSFRSWPLDCFDVVEVFNSGAYAFLEINNVPLLSNKPEMSFRMLEIRKCIIKNAFAAEKN